MKRSLPCFSHLEVTLKKEDVEEMTSHCASVILIREEKGHNKKSSNRITRLNNTTE